MLTDETSRHSKEDQSYQNIETEKAFFFFLR